MHRVEKPAYIRCNEVMHALVLEGPTPCVQTLVRIPLATLAVATVFAEGRKQRFEPPFGGQCHDLVLAAAHPKRSHLLTARLRDRYPALGLQPVAHPGEAGGQILAIGLQIFGLHRLRHLIHAHGFLAFEHAITCP